MKTFEKSPCDAANETFVTSNRKKRTRPGFRGPQRYLHRCMVQQQETANKGPRVVTQAREIPRLC